MKLLTVPLFLLASLSMASIPSSCLKGASEPPTGYYEDDITSINDDVLATSTANTRFFGIRFCTDNVNERITSIQFWLKDEDSDELRAMEQMGPTFPEPEVVTCKRRKLKIANFYVDTVILY